jgi:hypothetical protein
MTTQERRRLRARLLLLAVLTVGLVVAVVYPVVAAPCQASTTTFYTDAAHKHYSGTQSVNCYPPYVVCSGTCYTPYSSRTPGACCGNCNGCSLY